MPNMKKIFFILLMPALHLSAALPPLYETLAEFKGLLDSPIIKEQLTSADVIETIQRNPKGFVITTNKSILEIETVYEKTAMIGPQKFHFEFYSKRDRELGSKRAP
jgi:hypothetical protein